MTPSNSSIPAQETERSAAQKLALANFLRGHDHTCHCGGSDVPHETGTSECKRFMTDAPIAYGDTWYVDGNFVTDETLRFQRGYHKHPCGCWSRWPGSDESVAA